MWHSFAMQRAIQIQLYLTILLLALLVPASKVKGEETYITNVNTESASEIFSDSNWFTVKHPLIAAFSVHTDGSSYGTTTSGVSFSQLNIQNEIDARIQRFEIGDYFHYIVNGKITKTLEDLSAQLANAVSSQN